jgi:hypothetical protein
VERLRLHAEVKGESVTRPILERVKRHSVMSSSLQECSGCHASRHTSPSSRFATGVVNHLASLTAGPRLEDRSFAFDVRVGWVGVTWCDGSMSAL